MIVFKDFTYKYKSQKDPTLKHIDLEINDGEKILIAGPSGSGKSTLGNCINGLIPHSLGGAILGGSATIAGMDLEASDIYEINKKVGTVLQDTDCQFVGLTAEEDIAFSLENQNVPRPEMARRVREVASVVSMEDFLSQAPASLSGGQKQRISLCGVLIDDVDILLFDEPLANLDPLTGQKAIELIDELHKRTGKTVVIIEHRLEDVLHRGVDRIVLMDDGRIVSDTTADELLHTPALRERGIREPLYLSALKLAGCPIEGQDLTSLDAIDPATYSEPLRSWALAHRVPPRPAEGKPILEFQGVDFSYDGTRPVLQDISFSVRQGEMVSIMGKNGAGKSTLAKLAMGLCRPDKGRILIDGRDGEGDTITARSRDVGYVMQNPNHMISCNLIYDEVAFGLRQRGVPEEKVRESVKAVLRLCGLHRHINWPVSALSYGQKKRVTIASILVMQPKILILDEPTAAQDYNHYKDLMDFLAAINRDLGITIIFITHDMHLAIEYTARAIVLSDGRLLRDGRTARLFDDAALLERANLKTTSLHSLARKAGIDDIPAFIDSFIAKETGLRDAKVEAMDFAPPPLGLGGLKRCAGARRREAREAGQGGQKIRLGLSYLPAPSFVHRLAGTTKLLFFAVWIALCLTTFDIRILLCATVVSQAALLSCKVPFKRFRPFIILMLSLLALNALFIFLFSPEQGTQMIGSQTVILGGAEFKYHLTLETLWYLLVVSLKYFTIFPIALLFVTATNPSELASSLNRLRIGCRTSYAVSLTLRYLPELIDDCEHISQSQQCRGVDLSNNAPLKKRIAGLGKIVAPLVLSSLDKIDVIANAMILRGFARSRTRTWYTVSKMRAADYLVLALEGALLAASLILRFGLKVAFYYPF